MNEAIKEILRILKGLSVTEQMEVIFYIDGMLKSKLLEFLKKGKKHNEKIS